MASNKKLPDCTTLAEHARNKMTRKEISLLYGVTPEAVRQAFIACGIEYETQKPNYSRFIPWRVRADHVGHPMHKMLRRYAKKQLGREMRPNEERLLEKWIKMMEGENYTSLPLSVHYNRMDDDGFWLEPKRPEDRDFIHPPAEPRRF